MALPGLTASPQAFTVSPAASIFLAALTSRSCGRHTPGRSTAAPTTEGVEDMPTGRAAFGTGIPPVNLDERAPVPSRFVLQLPHQLAPPRIPDGIGEPVIADHLLTASDSTHTVWFSRMRRVVSLCRPSSRWSAILAWIRATLRRAFSRFLRPFLLAGEVLCAVFDRRWLRAKCLGLAIFSPVESVTSAETPMSNPITAVRRQRRDLLFHQEGDEVAACWVPCDGDGRRRASEGARPADVQRRVHLRQRQAALFGVPAEGRGGVVRRLPPALLLEGRVLGAALEEVAEGAVEMAQRLLRRHTGDLVEPRGLRLAFEGGQRRRRSA